MTAPRCRLFLSADMTADAAAAPALVTAALAAGDVAAIRVPEGAHQEAIARAILPAVNASNAVVILAGEDGARLSRRLGCHGAEFTDPSAEDIAAARATLGAEGMIGAACTSRHAAMTAAEAGVDYIAFAYGAASSEDGEPVFSWWQDLFETPCVCLTALEEPQAAEIIAAGADFICPSASMWQSPQAAAEAVRRYNGLITAA